jgi:hypothetical protein
MQNPFSWFIENPGLTIVITSVSVGIGALLIAYNSEAVVVRQLQESSIKIEKDFDWNAVVARSIARSAKNTHNKMNFIPKPKIETYKVIVDFKPVEMHHYKHDIMVKLTNNIWVPMQRPRFLQAVYREVVETDPSTYIFHNHDILDIGTKAVKVIVLLQ